MNDMTWKDTFEACALSLEFRGLSVLLAATVLAFLEFSGAAGPVLWVTGCAVAAAAIWFLWSIGGLLAQFADYGAVRLTVQKARSVAGAILSHLKRVRARSIWPARPSVGPEGAGRTPVTPPAASPSDPTSR